MKDPKIEAHEKEALELRLKLGLLLTVGPEHSHSTSLLPWITQALRAQHHVYLYCIDEGVRAICLPEWQQLQEQGLALWACAYGAEKRGIPIDQTATFGGLSIVADLIAYTDWFFCVGSHSSLPSFPFSQPQPQRRKILITTSNPPQESPQTAETLRIAAGIAAWDKIDITLLLQGKALYVLSSSCENLQEGPDIQHYLESFLHHCNLSTPQASDRQSSCQLALCLSEEASAPPGFIKISPDSLPSFSQSFDATIEL